MHIGIDLRCLPTEGEEGAGIPHAARELVRSMILASGGSHQLILYVPRASIGDKERSIFEECCGLAGRIVRLETATGRSLRRALQRNPCKLLFVPSGAVAPMVRIPCVPWVHDIAIFEHPEWFDQTLFKRALTTNLFRKGLIRAPEILAVSQFTKDELVRRFALDPSRVTVTLEGGDSVLGHLAGTDLATAKQKAKRRLAERGVIQPFILYLGTLEPRKNIPVLLEAWLDARSLFRRPVDLVIAGRDGWKLGPIVKSLEAARTYKTEGGSRLHRIEAPTDEHRRDLLLAAELVALPSLYEGFGLVALEAMQAGTAVISSTGGALPEVVGEAGISLPPDDVAAWAKALVEIMADPESRKSLADRGKSRSVNLTWERAARVTLDVLTRIQT